MHVHVHVTSVCRVARHTTCCAAGARAVGTRRGDGPSRGPRRRMGQQIRASKIWGGGVVGARGGWGLVGRA
eukprot:scaffold50252_cov60-Phaeocystis_antarctica.AAC.1